MAQNFREEFENAGQNGTVSLSDLNPEQLRQIKSVRWRARYDSMFLGTQILNMEKLLSERTHGPLLRSLQQFPKPTRLQFEENDIVIANQWEYKPAIADMRDLPGKRDRLILDSRGKGKTALNCELHTVQWLINYPEIAIAIFQASKEKAIDILFSIKQHFMDNPKFRMYFPEFCPPPGEKNFGTQAAFTTPARSKYFKRARREESVMAAALEAGMTGYHFEVMKFSDVVTSDNTLTPEQIRKTIDLFDKTKYQSIMIGQYWRDVEGTRYHFDDLYGDIIKKYQQQIELKGSSYWQVYCNGCWEKETNGKERQYIPEEIYGANALPDKLDALGKRIPVFPIRPEDFTIATTLDSLEFQEQEDPANFRAQMENNPVGGIDGQELFADIAQRVISAAVFKQNVNPAYNVVMVDSAQTDTVRANYTAIVCGTVDRFGRLYIVNIILGKFKPSELYQKIIGACNQYKPLYLIMEKSNFNEAAIPALQREWDLFPHYRPEVRSVPIDNQKRKVQKIKDALEPAYTRGDFRFVQDWIPSETLEHAFQEFRQFPKSLNDDVMDAICAFYDARRWFGREFDKGIARGGLTPTEYAFMELAGIPILDFDKTPQPANLLSPANLHEYYKRTGGL